MSNVWTNGCYDILHIGHIRLFQYAKSLGDTLFVGIDSDERIRNNKGNNRPYNNQNDRMDFLLSIKYIDDVFIFGDEKEMCDILLQNNVNIMVIGEEYKGRKITGENIIKDIRFFPRIEGFSTTGIINDKNNKYSFFGPSGIGRPYYPTWNSDESSKNL